MIPDALLWALRDAPVKDVEEWAVLVCMAGRADPDGSNTFQAVDTIAETTHLSPDTVKRRQRAMKARGLIGLGDQAAASRYRAGHRPTVHDVLVPYDWFGTSIARINRDREKDGLPPLTPESRPPIADAPAKSQRKDAGKPRKPADPAAKGTSDVGGLVAPPPREGLKHPHDDAPEGASGGARGGARGGATSTPTYKEDLEEDPPPPARPDSAAAGPLADAVVVVVRKHHPGLRVERRYVEAACRRLAGRWTPEQITEACAEHDWTNIRSGAGVTAWLRQLPDDPPAEPVRNLRVVRDVSDAAVPAPNVDPDDAAAYHAEVQALRAVLRSGSFDVEAYHASGLPLTGGRT